MEKISLLLLASATLSTVLQLSAPAVVVQQNPERAATRAAEQDILLSAHRFDMGPRVTLQASHVARSAAYSEAERKFRAAHAKLGDKAEQQRFVCELYGADKQKMQSMALEELPNIGGWYAIQMYRELLSPEARIRYYRAKNKPDRDSRPLSEPRFWSLAMLPKSVPNPPFGQPQPNIDNEELLRQIQLWKDWIQANESFLRKLQPTGDGIDFSGTSCGDAHRFPVGRDQIELNPSVSRVRTDARGTSNKRTNLITGIRFCHIRPMLAGLLT